MEGISQRRSGKLLAAAITMLLLTALVGSIWLPQASAAPDRGRDSRGELCADAARITSRALEDLDATLADLVTSGTLTREQADTVAASLTEGHSEGHTGRCAGMAQSVHAMRESVSDLLGIEWSEIRNRLAGGESLAEIAEAEGVSRDDLISTMLSGVTERLDAAEAEGRIAPEERAEREQAARERIERRIDRHLSDAAPDTVTDSGTPDAPLP